MIAPILQDSPRFPQDGMSPVKAPALVGPVAERIESALHHDFFPWANRYVYWLKHPLTVLSIAALVGLAVGMSQATQGYVVFGVVSAVIALGIAWPWIGLSGVTATLRFDRPRTVEGEAVDAILTVVNTRPWPVCGLVVETRQSLGEGEASADDVQFAMAKLPGWSTNEFRWSFTPPSRGEFPRWTLAIATAFPFGLWRRSRPVEVLSRLITWPRTTKLDEATLESDLKLGVGTYDDRRTGHEGDVIGVRPFRQGDLLRHVHWAQTARQGRMIVCERQKALQTRAVVIVDVAPGSHWRTSPGDTSLDAAFRAAGSIALSLLRSSVSLELRLGNRVIAAGAGHEVERTIMDALARFTAHDETIADVRDAIDRTRDVATRFLVATSRSHIDVSSDRITIVSLEEDADDPYAMQDAIHVPVAENTLGVLRAIWGR